MKLTDKKKPVGTIPKGVWEGSHTDEGDRKKEEHSSDAATDLQGNGYPVDGTQK